MDFNVTKIQIYTICSIDAHGFTSNYSTQYAVRFNPGTNKCEVDMISSSGAPLHMPNLLMPRKTKFFANDESIVENICIEENIKKISLYATPEFNNVVLDSGRKLKIYNEENENESKFKLSIFKLENSSTFIDNISIFNFNNWILI